jgi:EAL domain-containing protein (putative c-di-GMP-specific phosphodiesterase class I)
MDLLSPDLLPLPDGLGLTTLADGTVIGRFLHTDLSSVFQALIDSGSGACLAHEAFVRVHGDGDRTITPWNLFSRAADDQALVALDRLCRYVHALNFLRRPKQPGRLFLNVHGRLLVAVRQDHGHTFRRALDSFALDHTRVVIETPQTANFDLDLLALVHSNFRLNGFAVAANALDIADLERLLRVLRPDFVKIDARQVTTPTAMQRAIALARDKGTRIVFTRVASGAQRDFLQTQPGLLLQGWAIGQPSAVPDASLLAAAPA